MLLNAISNNISAISGRSVLLVEETGVTCRKSLTDFITKYITMNGTRTRNVSGGEHRLHR
jgi:hypothetical protein